MAEIPKSAGFGLREMIAEKEEEEKKPEPVKTETKVTPLIAKPTEEVRVSAPSLTNEAFWTALLGQINQRRPLTLHWAQVATLLGIENDVVKLGFPKSEEAARDSLMRETTRAFLEEVGATLLGRKVSFQMVIDPNLMEPDFKEMTFGFAETEAITPKAEVEVPVESTVATVASEAPAPSEGNYNDPVIKRAVERFKLKLMESPPPASA